MECLAMVGDKLLDCTLAPMKRQVSYLIFYNSNVKELKEKAENLQHARASVQERVDAAYRNGDEIYDGVQTWLKKIDEMARKVEGHIQDDHHKKTRCSSRSFPNLWMRHQLSRKSKKMVQEIESLNTEGKFDHVSYRKASNLILNLSSATGDEDFGSRVETLEAIMEALRDPNVNKIGVYGMAGVGKSTLVKQVAQKAQEEFDVVVMATITQNPEVEKIQGQIADMLGLNLTNEQSLMGRASRLLERLKKERNVLIILDDIWEKLNWDEIGIPSLEKHTYNNKKINISSEMQQRNCKFLMTSRIREVLSNMNSQKQFFVRPLQDIEAWKLFKEKAEFDESIGNAELLSIAHEVAQECGGLPLAVVTIASSLKNKRISEWKVVLQELRNPAPTDTGSSKKYCEIHDVVRDVAFLVASKYEYLFVKSNEILEEWPEEEQMKNCKTIILWLCDLNDLFERLCCPNLTFLLINNQDPSLKLSDNLFERIPRLKVLDLTRIKFESLPSSISLLSNLRTLCLDLCSSGKIEVIGELKRLKVLSLIKSDVKQLPQELGQLTQLQLLDLTGCSQLKLIPPHTLSSLKKLEELYMEDSFANWDVNDPMDQQQSNASVSELDNLPLLTTLVVHIPDERMLPKVLTFERLQKYKILIGNVWDWSSETETSRILKLWLSTSVHLRDDIKRLLDTVEELHIGKLEGAMNVLPALNNEGLPQLQHLFVTDNDEIQCVINSLEVIHSVDLFPNLESMVLQNVMNLEELCSGSLTGESFSKLKIIKVKNCVNLRSLLPASIARSLPHLVEIELEECFRVERVVYDDEKAACILQFPKLCSLTIQSLPLLLGFHYEGNVLGTSDAFFCEKVMFPSLEKLTIDGLDKLNMIWNRVMAEDNSHNSPIREKMKETWHGQIVNGSFCNLKTLLVANCEGISKVLSFSLLNLLKNLEELEVEGCNSVEVVFDLEKITSEERHVVPKCHLGKLILTSLPNLKHVWNKDPQGILDFQNLSTIEAIDCPHMNYLLPVSVAKALPNLLELVLENCTGLENIVAMEEGLDATVRFMFPKVTELWLWDLPKFKGFYPGGFRTKWPQLRKLVYLFIPKEVNCFEDGPQAFVQQSSSVEEVIPNLQELVLDCDDSALVTWLLEHSESYFNKIKLLRLQDFQEEKMILSYSFIQRISKVDTLVVVDNSFEEIFPYENQAGDGTEHENVVRVKNLHLENLPKLRQICKKGYNAICKEGYNVRLNNLWVWKCPRLSNLMPSSVILSHLTSLSVYKCEGLLHLVAPSTAKTLSQLTVMKIEECKMINEIVADKVNADAEEGDHEITFNKMKIIKLKSLPLLESFSSGNYAFKFPSLENALICECPNLKIFSKGVPITPKLRKVEVELEDKDWYWEGDLNKTVQKMYSNKALINLEELEVKNCSNAEVVFLLDGKDIDDKNVILTTKMKKLILSNLPNLKRVWNKDYRTVAFKNLQGVHVSHCERLSYLFPANVAIGLTQLGELHIRYCGFEEIVAKEEGQAMFVSFVFPKLASLVIRFVPQLKRFYPGRHTVEWPALKELNIFIEGEVKVFGTHGQRNLNSSIQQPIFFIEKVFPNLESLRLHNKDDILDWLGQFSIEHFRRLNLLQLHFFYKEEDSFPYWLLHRLPNLKNLLVGDSYFKEIFSKEGGYTNDHLQLEVLILVQLPKLKYICKEAPSSVSFNELTHLEVSNCDGLLHLVTTSTAKSLVRLETMKIKECWMIKEIVTNKPDDEAGDEITFGNLKILELQQLSSLTSFSSGDYNFKFPSLETIIVSLCPNLKTFSRGIPITPKVQRVLVGDQEDRWYWEGNLNATLHKMYINTEAYGKIRKEMNESSEDESSYVSEPALSNTDIDKIEMDKDHHLEDHQELVDIVELLSPSEGTQEETSDLDIPEQ
ncbi:hypothetical protein L6164_026390 [Bauhinia variegata]|uniref:Uncharacterized protein n=1 Tax=Bauhinia variegata TaxID=167791 RepID=A0ACB9LPZ2_BAUVA|nr:hypothetical protein L6164_026390 [Bauhinia variegata]